MQARFVEAALHSHEPSCNDNANATPFVPLVILLDDIRGTSPLAILESSLQLYQTTVWYQLMSLSVPNAVGHTLLGNFNEHRKIGTMGVSFGFVFSCWRLMGRLVWHIGCSDDGLSSRI
jgi:hypothetical protein